MLKIILASILIIYTLAPPVVAGVVLGDFPAVFADDPWGCKSCIQCGMIDPIMFLGAAAFFMYLGVQEMRKK